MESKGDKPASRRKPPNADITKAREVRMENLPSQTERKKERLAGRKPIPRDQSYPLETFKKLAGLTESGLAAARRAGLRVKKVGDSSWITGEEWFRWLNQAEDSTQLG